MQVTIENAENLRGVWRTKGSELYDTFVVYYFEETYVKRTFEIMPFYDLQSEIEQDWEREKTFEIDKEGRVVMILQYSSSPEPPKNSGMGYLYERERKANRIEVVISELTPNYIVIIENGQTLKLFRSNKPY